MGLTPLPLLLPTVKDWPSTRLGSPMTMIAATKMVRCGQKVMVLLLLTLVGDRSGQGSGLREIDGAGTAESVQDNMSTL